jgi:hypothetical protein
MKLSIIVEIDISNFVIGTILSQKEDRVQEVAFYFRKIIITELNYNIYDKEILGSVSVFKE